MHVNTMILNVLCLFLLLHRGYTQFCDDNDDTCTVANESNPEAKSPCSDLHERCDLWSEEGECRINPRYMLEACRASCLVCIDKDLYDLNDPGGLELLRKDTVFVEKIDIGVHQATNLFPGEERKTAQLLQVIRDFEFYARNEVTDFENEENIKNCTNKKAECAGWVVNGDCDTNVAYMMENCPLACELCDELETFNKCSKTGLPRVIKTGYDMSHDIFDHIVSSNDFDVKILSSPAMVDSSSYSTLKYKEDDAHPWLVTVDNFLNKEQCDYLINMGNVGGWKVLDERANNDSIRRQFAYSFPCNDTPLNNESSEVVSLKCQEDDEYQSILRHIASFLNMGKSHFEDINLQRFHFGQSVAFHSDYQPTDFWKPAGVRLISFYVFLSDVDKGGALGFPDIDWTFVKPKRGRAVVWSNVLDSDTFIQNDLTKNEDLPVESGEKYIGRIFVHPSDWQSQLERGCT